MKSSNRIKILIQKFIENKCSLIEINELVAYFKKNQITHEFPQVEQVLEILNDIPQMDKDSAQRIYNQILEKKKTGDLKNLNRQKKFYRYGAVAAIVFIMFGGTFFLGLMKNKLNINETPIATENMIILEREGGIMEVLLENGEAQLTDKKGRVVGEQNGQQLVYIKNIKSSKEIEYNTLNIPYGKQFQVQLSDGTVVILNSGSTLKFPVNFPRTGKRKVYLTGEAFFKVIKNEENPFIVNVDNLEIDVLGTEFNVSAYPEDNSSSVALVHGSVRLRVKEENADLVPGQLGKLNRNENTLEVHKVDTEIHTAWIQGDLVFRNTSFDDILLRMERNYNVKFINKNTQLAKEKFNARFDNEPLTNILDYFNKVYGLNYIKKNNDTIVIK